MQGEEKLKLLNRITDEKSRKNGKRQGQGHREGWALNREKTFLRLEKVGKVMNLHKFVN